MPAQNCFCAHDAALKGRSSTLPDSMPTLRSSDAQLFYEVAGNGPNVVLLHPFPLNHSFWRPVAEQLGTRYRLIMPDLRAHGDSELGDGPASMEKLAADLARSAAKSGSQRDSLSASPSAGMRCSSSGGDIASRSPRWFWRIHVHQAKRRRAGRIVWRSRTRSFAKVRRDSSRRCCPSYFSRVTLTNRPDIVDAARRMMQKMSPQDIAGVQQGMADRPDSIPTLKTISVPTLVIVGEDETTAEAELMRQQIPGSRLQVVPRAGHYAALEQPEEFARLLRSFLDGLPRQ